MRVTHCALLAAAFLGGCAEPPPPISLPADHPANPDAPESPALVEESASTTQPVAAPMEHSHHAGHGGHR